MAPVTIASTWWTSVEKLHNPRDTLRLGLLSSGAPWLPHRAARPARPSPNLTPTAAKLKLQRSSMHLPAWLERWARAEHSGSPRTGPGRAGCRDAMTLMTGTCWTQSIGDLGMHPTPSLPSGSIPFTMPATLGHPGGSSRAPAALACLQEESVLFHGSPVSALASLRCTASYPWRMQWPGVPPRSRR